MREEDFGKILDVTVLRIKNAKEEGYFVVLCRSHLTGRIEVWYWNGRKQLAAWSHSYSDDLNDPDALKDFEIR